MVQHTSNTSWFLGAPLRPSSRERWCHYHWSWCHRPRSMWWHTRHWHCRRCGWRWISPMWLGPAAHGSQSLNETLRFSARCNRRYNMPSICYPNLHLRRIVHGYQQTRWSWQTNLQFSFNSSGKTHSSLFASERLIFQRHWCFYSHAWAQKGIHSTKMKHISQSQADAWPISQGLSPSGFIQTCHGFVARCVFDMKITDQGLQHPWCTHSWRQSL